MDEPDLLGVRNIAPKGRVHKVKNRETIEKDRLKQRNFGFIRHGSEIDNILETTQASPAFQNENDRFKVDACKEEREILDKKIQRKNQILDTKRTRKIQAEEKRWKTENSIFEKEKIRLEDQQKLGLKAKRNCPSMPYDIVNLSYAPTFDGQRLRHKDDMSKYRSKCRSANLDARQNSNFNPITGAKRRMMNAGSAPELPEVIKQQIQN